MNNNMLPRGHLERIRAPVKVLSNPYWGNHYPFMPAVPNETFGVANGLRVQGRFIHSALHPVGEAMNHLNLGMFFGDSKWGVNRRKGDKKKKHGRDESEDEVVKKGGKKGTLVPDIVFVEDERHTIRALCEVKTHWAFEPGKEETWKSFTARKFGQLSRYMDDHHCRYGIYTVYEYTWFLKRVDDTHFAVSQPISASSVSTSSALSLRECLLALVIAVADKERSYYPARYGKRLQKLIPQNTFPEFKILHCELIFRLPALNSEIH
ncbi:hypothetical protein BO79DRAFT_227159 [Aspergillus costaricaensis CBS 115574]|uniref:Uncharacterized protein n=1 Tax=Aspergillus costaricaensis CBS 115574 TaxID=1448317 RepID=A0ACD1IIE3_9EURO|nr:hypothetical protein BO79DRAFT_227159 [Aspergillus costaricaensis CBS 115574]RAK90228.1 hypothetical protein BO79DRAFT_227159 [Aspergillus costaricaensis CBS 115574]